MTLCPEDVSRVRFGKLRSAAHGSDEDENSIVDKHQTSIVNHLSHKQHTTFGSAASAIFSLVRASKERCNSVLLNPASPYCLPSYYFSCLSPYTIEYLRHLKDFFGIVFKLKADAETQSVLVSCLGVGFKNLSKASF